MMSYCVALNVLRVTRWVTKRRRRRCRNSSNCSGRLMVLVVVIRLRFTVAAVLVLMDVELVLVRHTGSGPATGGHVAVIRGTHVVGNTHCSLERFNGSTLGFAMRRSWRAFSRYIHPSTCVSVCFSAKCSRPMGVERKQQPPTHFSTPSVRRSGVCVCAARNPHAFKRNRWRRPIGRGQRSFHQILT